MAKLKFQAQKATGEMIRGEIEAANVQQARVKLKAMRLNPISVQAPPTEVGGDFLSQLLVKRVPEKDLKIFTRQFAVLVDAGIPIVDALRILASTAQDITLKKTVSEIQADIEAGSRLAQAIGKHKHVFDNLYINLVKAGEEAGVLAPILVRLAEYIEKSSKLKNKVKSAMWYPSAIVLFTIAAVIVIMIFVVPQFESLYSGTGKEPPMLTLLVSTASRKMAQYWYLILPSMIVTPFLAIGYYRSDDGRKAFDSFILDVPLFGQLVQKSAIASFTRTLSTLLKSGVDVISALDISSKTAGNHVIETAILRSKKSISEGKMMSTPLKMEKTIPDMVTQMIAIGEASGNVDDMLSKIADFYEEETENMVGALTSIIEPVLMVFIGGVVAVLVMAIYMPIFNMAGVVSGQ